MVEAVSVIASNTPIVRSNADPVDVARASAISPAKVEASASLPQAPYVSPYIYVDQNFHKAVTQIRDSSTGRVIGQFPSEHTLDLRHAQAEQATQSAPTPPPAATSAAPVATSTISTATVAPQASAATPPPPAQAQAASAALTSVSNGGAQGKTVNITA